MNDVPLPLPPPEPPVCPISELLDVRITEMSDDELETFIVEMRQITESQQSLGKVLRRGSSKPSPKKAAKIDLSFLDL